LCTKCGQCPAVVGKNGCINCNAKHNTLTKLKQRRAKSKGLCAKSCGRPLIPNAGGYCKECWFKRHATKLWGDAKKYPELIQLMESQNWICPYTGRQLIIGINASLDHKLASDKGGINEISNLHFVDTRANIAKSFLTEEEFFQLCRDVAKLH